MEILQRASAGSRFWHRRKHSVEIGSAVLEDELGQDDTPAKEAVIVQSSSITETSPVSSLHVQTATHTAQSMKEEWAATRIQTAFRAFLVCTTFLVFPIGSCITVLIFKQLREISNLNYWYFITKMTFYKKERCEMKTSILMWKTVVS